MRTRVAALVVLLPMLVGASPRGYAFSPQGHSPDRFPTATTAEEITLTVGGRVQRGNLWRPDTSSARQWRSPVILVPSIYNAVADNSDVAWLVERFTPKGYAVAQVDLPGTGRSDGCFDFFGPDTEQAVTSWVSALSAAPWSNGNVAAFGFSADGEAGLLAAVARADGLATVVAVAASSGIYDGYSYLDGVSFLTETFLGGGVRTPSAATAAVGYALLALPGHQPRGPQCHLDNARNVTDPGGTFTSWFQARETRARADNITVPVLTWHSWRDPVVKANTLVDWVDRLPAGSTTFVSQDPAHRLPQAADGVARYEAWPAVMHAWLDDHLLDLPTATHSWPRLQAQAEDGSWRAVRSFAALTQSRPQQLPAAPAGPVRLDATPRQVWQSAPLPESLHLAGQPSIDAIVTFDQPDAHVMLELREVTADGSSRVVALGAGSAPHLLGTLGSPAPVPVGEPVPLHVRSWPVDVTVARGSRLVLLLSTAHDAFLPAERPATGTIQEVAVNLPHAVAGVPVTVRTAR